jgi:glycine hydroxymethyltransferase
MKRNDQEIFDILDQETKRQKETIELIASENFVSKEVLEVTGSIFTNKYAEGYPNARYYGGCANVDKVEQLAIDRVKKLFDAKFANVQTHSGSQANTAAYYSILEPGDKILGMALDCGGHLTHGHKVNFSGKIYESHFYVVDKETEMIDYDIVLKRAKEVKPKLIIAGASAYSRIIDFKKFREIADEVGAYLLVDMAHIAGLIAVGLQPSPMEYADIVTSTTHKTLRGARGGLILTNKKEIAQKIDKAVFPGNQGGPLMHVIAGKAIAFYEALQPSYKTYIKSVVENSKAMAEEFIANGARVVTGGTDNHLFMLDIKKTYDITGQDAEDALFNINIIVNKNTIPFDEESPRVTSGIRIGTPAMTTHGFTKNDFIELAKIIDASLKNIKDKKVQDDCKDKVNKLLKVKV